MTTEEKFTELGKLSNIDVHLDSRDTWIVTVDADIIRGKRKMKRTERGNTWDEAVNEAWRVYSEPKAIIRVNGRNYTWIGVGWQETMQEVEAVWD